MGARCRGETGVSNERGQPLDTAPEKRGLLGVTGWNCRRGFPPPFAPSAGPSFGPAYRGARSGNRRLFLRRPRPFRGRIEGLLSFIDSPAHNGPVAIAHRGGYAPGVERGCQDELIDALAAEIDGTLIDERLRLTPTERLESMRRVLEFIDAVRRRGDDRPTSAR